MRTKITALALGLLLLVVPGAFAQYGGGGGAQTFTVPTLTINPGPLTLAGTFTIAGDLDFGADLVFGGTTFETTLTFTDPAADRTVTFQDASGDVALLPLAGVSTFALATSLATNEVDVANSVWGVSNGLAFGGATGGNGFELTISPQNDPAGSIAVVIPNLTASAAMVSSLTTNDFNVANSVWGVSNGLAFGGATGANGFELTLSPQTDPTADFTVSIPNTTTSAAMISSLTTNDVDVANSIWGVSNGLAFGGTTGANGFEVTLSPGADPGADIAVSLPIVAGDVAVLPAAGASSFAIATSLVTNEVDVANSIWGVSNGLAFGGATGANGFELTLSPQTDPTADFTVSIPNTTTSAAMISSLTTNDVDVANSVWGVSNGLTFEGTAADAFESFLTVAEPAASSKTWTLPNITGTVALVDAANIGAGTTSLTTTAATDVGTYSFGANLTELQVSDGTDIARAQIDSSGFLIDGDNDDDGDGAVTLQVANETTKVALSSTGVAITSAGNEQHIQSGFTSYRYQDTKTFVDETPLDLVKLAFADEGHAAGSFQYVATAANGTNVQAVSGLAMFACINQGDTEACTITMQEAEAAAADAGTLACTVTIDADEANAVMFVVNCNQEADDAGGTFNWIIELMNGGVTATLQ